MLSGRVVSAMMYSTQLVAGSPALLGIIGACFGIFSRFSFSLYFLLWPLMCLHPLFYFSCFCFLIFIYSLFPALLHFVVLCFMVYQIEMAIETLQKSEGLSSQRSSLLNSHVSCFFFFFFFFLFSKACLRLILCSTLLLFCLPQLSFKFEFGVVLSAFVCFF